MQKVAKRCKQLLHMPQVQESVRAGFLPSVLGSSRTAGASSVVDAVLPGLLLSLQGVSQAVSRSKIGLAVQINHSHNYVH